MHLLKEKHVFGKFFIKTLCGAAAVNHIRTMRRDSLWAPAGPSAVSPQVQGVQPIAHGLECIHDYD